MVITEVPSIPHNAKIESSPDVYGIAYVSSVFQDTEVHGESGRMWDALMQTQEPSSIMPKSPEPAVGGRQI